MIIVTGGSGKAGRACITELLAHNYEVASVDLVRPPDVPVPFSRVELTDFGQTIETFSQIDDRIRNVTAIVHLAAIPAPGLATNSVTFATNTISTYNVFEAARQLGTRMSCGPRAKLCLASLSMRRRPMSRLTKNITGDRNRPIRSPNWLVKKWQNSFAVGTRS